jgi:Rad3-related DNA helicase
MLVSKDRQEILSELTRKEKGSIVLSASIEKGFDAKGDIARWQIIPKVPYLYLGDPLVSLNSKIRPNWYARKAILRIVQAAGRVTRGVDDHGVTYILDSNFSRLLSQNADMFPSWFLDSLVLPK